jgi:prepilin-type N-terminal cleavage/methylation domain-containing protein
MNNKGFGLLELVIVVGVIAILSGGGWYLAQLQNEQSTVRTGINAEQQARQVVQQVDQQAGQEQKATDQTTGNSVTTSTKK